eukprot:COSAG01_NODE_36228_length_520_cov_1.223278_1_plen_58_part_01
MMSAIRPCIREPATGLLLLQCILRARQNGARPGGLRTHMSSDQPSKKQKTTADTMVQV